MKWVVPKLDKILPNRPFGKTHRDNVNARLIDINRLIESINPIFDEIAEEIEAGSGDSNNQTLVIGGEGDELRLRDGTLNGTPIPDSVIPISQIAQGFDFEDISDVPAYSGNALKGLRVNGVANGIEYYVASDTDSNSWGMDQVAFVSPTANFGTGAIGFANTQTSADTPNTAFRNVTEANASGASTIVLLPGYHGNITMVSNKTYYCYPGARAFRLRDGGATVTNTKVLGKLVFDISSSVGVELTGSGSDVSVEIDEMDNVRTIAWVYNGSTLYLKARKIFCNGSNGAPASTRCRNGSKITLEVTESLTVYYFLYNPRDGKNSFTVRCPDIRQIPGGAYGSTAYGALAVYPGSVQDGGDITVDLMGGKLTRTRGQGTSFGVRDNALVKVTNCFGGDPTPIIKVQNGYVDAGNTLGVLIEYIVLRVHYELNNIQLKTTSKPIEMSQRAVNIAGWTEFCNFIARNCSFEGDLDNELGNCRIARFFDCNFKTLGGTSNFIFNNANGASPGEAYFVNCNAELTTGPGEMLTGFTGKTIGLLNTYSNEPIGAGAVDTWGGHSTIPTLTLPNIEL